MAAGELSDTWKRGVVVSGATVTVQFTYPNGVTQTQLANTITTRSLTVQ